MTQLLSVRVVVSQSAFAVGLGRCVVRAQNHLAVGLRSNMALNLAPSGRWPLRHKAAQRRLALR